MTKFNLKKNPTPTNQTAANVVYKGGFYERFSHKSSEKLSTTPFPVRNTPKDTEDFTGHKKGQLTVIGAYDGVEVGKKPCGSNRRAKPQGHGWVCRCNCGNYTVRKTRSLRKNSFDACIECTSLNVKRSGKRQPQEKNARHLNVPQS